MMLANDLKTYYDEVRRYLDCPKDEQDRLLLSVNKQVIELQVDNPNLDYDGIVEFLGEPESLAASLIECLSPDVIQVYHKKKKRKHARLVACIVVVIVALSLSSVCAILAKSQAEFTQSDIVIITISIQLLSFLKSFQNSHLPPSLQRAHKGSIVSIF